MLKRKRSASEERDGDKNPKHFRTADNEIENPADEDTLAHEDTLADEDTLVHEDTLADDGLDDGLDDDLDRLTEAGQSEEYSEDEDELRNQIFDLEYLCYNNDDYFNLQRIDYLIPPPPLPPLPQPLDEHERLKYTIPSCREMPDWVPEAVFGHTEFVESSLITHDLETHLESDQFVVDIVYDLFHLYIAAGQIFGDDYDDDSTTNRDYESWMDE